MADEPQRHRIVLVCPECGHNQTEPALVISTQCRSCRTNFQVRDGKAVPRVISKARVATPGVPHPAAAPPPPESSKPKPPTRPAPPKKNFLQRLIFPTRPPREVVCFSCGRSFKALAEAQSSQCPACGAYVSLADFDIEESWNRRIETRGNVTIRKNGYISACIRCHDITILGKAAR